MTLTKLHTERNTFSPIIAWIDGELVECCVKQAKITGSEALLDLRHLFSTSEGRSLNSVFGEFYKVLPQLEKKHYLLGYRIRQWLSYNFLLVISDPLERFPQSSNSLCQTIKTLETEKKRYFESSDYNIPYHDIRVMIKERNK